LSRIGSWVLTAPRWQYLSALFTIMFLRTGVTFVAPVLVPIVENPYRNPFANPREHYLYWSWLGPFLAHQIGATDPVTLTLLYLGFAILFSILVVRWLFGVLDDHLARVALLIFALLPVSAVPYYWIFNDSLTLLLLAGALYVPDNRVVLVLLGIGLGLQHFEQGFVAAGGACLALFWAARRGARRPYDWRWAFALLIGTVAGKLLLLIIFALLDVDVNSGRLFWLADTWKVLLRRFAYSAHFALFSAFGVGWLVMIRFLGHRSAEVLPAGATLLALLLLMPISDDPTRVVAIATFPLLCVLVLRNPEFLATIPRDTIGLWALLWCLVPWMFVWSGRPIVSALAYDLLSLLHHLFGVSHPPQDPRFPL
jgi:hypothetical protein